MIDNVNDSPSQGPNGAYFLDLFSPATYQVFGDSSYHITGFRLSQKCLAEKIHPGDKFICYLTTLGRMCGLLRVESEYFIDTTPLFSDDDPFIVRFRTTPLVWLPVERAVPIKANVLWTGLSWTRGHQKGGSTFTGTLRNSLNKISDEDGSHIERVLWGQEKAAKVYEIDDTRYRKFIRRGGLRKIVTVAVPEGEAHAETSCRMQALVARIGETMGFQIWIPMRDRTSVFREWRPKRDVLLSELPLHHFDAPTLRTVERIDVLWVQSNFIYRAFEVEHTTSVSSGLNRMLDLLALQPNLRVKLHIVAPSERRRKAFREIKRPGFSLSDRFPALSEQCTFISYDKLKELAEEKHLRHMRDSVIDEYAEQPT
jgi:hypothetical protein